MGKASILFSGDERMTLNKAILLYGGNSSFATIHDVGTDKKNGSTILMQGEPLTHVVISEIMRGLGQSVQIGAFLPPHILSVGHNSVVWWLKPASRKVFFRCSDVEKGIGEESAETSHPGLVFAVNESGWSVFAVKGNERPEASTPLYLSPYFNVSSNGAICTGTVDVPKNYSAESTFLWDKAFFDSAFSHPNVKPPQKLVDYKGGSYKFWRHMLDGKFKKFPEKVLVPVDSTVEKFIKAVGRGGWL